MQSWIFGLPDFTISSPRETHQLWREMWNQVFHILFLLFTRKRGSNRPMQKAMMPNLKNFPQNKLLSSEVLSGINIKLKVAQFDQENNLSRTQATNNEIRLNRTVCIVSSSTEVTRR
jgi:hypothetical protein